MKTILFTIALFFLSNLTFAQSSIGYKFNYEIKFDVAQFLDQEPKNTIRKFIDFIFEAQDQKFNVQTRYNEDGVIYVSSNNSIDESVVEEFFYSEKSVMLSFEKKPQHSVVIEDNNTVANN
jgi:hypothetical protein